MIQWEDSQKIIYLLCILNKYTLVPHTLELAIEVPTGGGEGEET